MITTSDVFRQRSFIFNVGCDIQQGQNMTKISLCVLCSLLAILLTHAQNLDTHVDADYDNDEAITDENFRKLRQEILDTESRINRKINRVHNKLVPRMKKLLPNLLEVNLIDLLKYHRFDKTLSKGYKNEVEKLSGEFRQVKSRMQYFMDQVRSSEDEKILLKKELAKNMIYTKRLEQGLALMKTHLGQFEKHLEEKVSSSCGCNQSALVAQHTPMTSSVYQTSPTSTSEVTVITAKRNISSITVKHERTKIIAVSQEIPQFVEISLKNKRMKNMVLKTYLVISVAYHPAANKIFWSTYGHDWSKSRGIYSSDMDGISRTPNLSDMTATAMKVDVKRDWIIFTTAHPQKTISRISSTGSDYTQMHNLSKYSEQQDIALDSQKQLIYTCDGDYIIESDYQGKHQRVLLLGGFIVTLAFDAGRHLLYYYEYDNIMKLHPKSGVTSVVKKGLNMVPSSMEFHEDKLYFGGYFEGFVKVFDTKTSAVTDLGSLKGNRIFICLIP